MEYEYSMSTSIGTETAILNICYKHGCIMTIRYTFGTETMFCSQCIEEEYLNGS